MTPTTALRATILFINSWAILIAITPDSDRISRAGGGRPRRIRAAGGNPPAAYGSQSRGALGSSVLAEASFSDKRAISLDQGTGQARQREGTGRPYHPWSGALTKAYRTFALRNPAGG